MSHLTQMAGLTVQNFVSAAVGIAVAIALVRGITRRRTETIGNFWVDLTRATTRILLPLALVLALVLRRPGCRADAAAVRPTAHTVAGATQVIFRRPGREPGGDQGARDERRRPARRELGAPVREPERADEPVEMWALLAIPFALTFAFGRLVGDRRQGWALFAAMLVLWVGSAALATWAEVDGNPQLAVRLGAVGANMEGKEVRFGAAASRPLRRLDDRHVDRRRQLRPRQLHAARRRGAARQHDARRGQPGRRRLRPLRDARLRPARRVHRRADGRANARVPRQEDPGGGDEARRALPPRRAARWSSSFARLSVLLDSATASILEPGPARALRGRLRVHVGGEQQRLRVRRAHRRTPIGTTRRSASRCSVGRFLLIVPALAIAGSLARKQHVPAYCRHASRPARRSSRAAGRRRADRRRPHVLPRPRARADPRASRSLSDRSTRRARALAARPPRSLGAGARSTACASSIRAGWPGTR